MAQRLTPAVEKRTLSSYVTVNMPRKEYEALRKLADAEGVAAHKVISGLIRYYEAHEDEISGEIMDDEVLCMPSP